MDATRGIHALLTTCLTLLLIWVTYDFATKYFSTGDSTLNTIYWTSYIIIILVTGIVIPILIATEIETESSLLSVGAAWLYYCAAVLAMSVLTPISEALINVMDTVLNAQVLSALWIVAIIAALYVIPIIIGAAPNLVTDR